MRWLQELRSRRRAARMLRERAAALYAEAVAAARDPRLYRDLRLPDTVDVRFEVLSLQVLLRARASRRLPGEGARLAQALVDTFFADLDRNLREMGVGDLSMGRKMKEIAATWMARVRDLGAALDAGDAETVAAVLRRNLGTAALDADLRELARHAIAFEARPGALAYRGPGAEPPSADPERRRQAAGRSSNSTRSR